MKKRINLYATLYYFMVIYILSTLTQDLISFIPLNRILFVGMIFCISAIMCCRIEKSAIVYVGLIGIDIALVHLVYNISGYLLDYVYFGSSLIWLLFIVNRERRNELLKEITKHEKVNEIVLWASVAIIGVALVTGLGYKSMWGGEAFFVGFSGLTHTAASSMCLVSSLALLMYSEKKFSWIIMFYLLVMCYGIFETGARTYIISALVIVYLYISKSNGREGQKRLIYATGLILAAVVLLKSNIISKFIYASEDNYNGFDKLTLFTSGRSVFWQIDIKGFWQGNLFAKIFGHGHGYTYYLNEKYYNLKIWAHNDFIQLLVGGGLLSLYIYIASLWKSVKNVISNHKLIDKGMLIAYFLFPAMFNGFYNYAHYFLSFIILCLVYDKVIKNQIGVE